MAFACSTHLIATEYLSVRKSKGEVLLFRQKRRDSGNRLYDEEAKAASSHVSLSTSDPKIALEAAESSISCGIVKAESVEELPLRPAAFLWNNLSYDIKLKKGSQQLLDDLEGWIMPGSLTALMVCK